jgi:hypothetical protein
MLPINMALMRTNLQVQSVNGAVGAMKMDFAICAVERVQKESMKVFRIKQTAKCVKGMDMLKVIMELKPVQFAMGQGRKVIKSINAIVII